MPRIIHLDYDPTDPNARPPSKRWRAKPITVDGIRFASQAEAKRYGELRMLEQAGVILDLITHPRYPFVVYDTWVGAYEADFEYVRAGTFKKVVEDVKSPVSRTAVYKLKRRLLKVLWGLDVVEIDA